MSDDVNSGRRNDYPFVMIPQWVLLLKADGGLSSAGFTLYCLLLAHVNATRGDGRMWVTQETMGKMLGMHPKTVGRLINGELKRLGLVDVATHRYGDNSARKRNVYTVHEVPDGPFTGFRSLGAWHRVHGIETDEVPTHILDKGQGTGSSMNPDMGDLKENSQVSPEVTPTLPPKGTKMLPPEGTPTLPPEATQVSLKQDEAKTRLLPPPPSSVGSCREEGEDKEAPAGQDDERIEIGAEDVFMAKRLYAAVPWPGRGSVGVKRKREILDRLAVLAAGGWSEERVREYVTGRIPDWTPVRVPADLVASVLRDCPIQVSEAFTPAVQPRDDDELAQAQEDAQRLEEQHAQQKIVIADCGVCDELGYVMPAGTGSIEWHGHGPMTLSSQKRKAQARVAQILEERETGETPWETGP